MTHARVIAGRIDAPGQVWMAWVHRCPEPVAGAGLGADLAEALANAEVGFASAVEQFHGERVSDG